MAFEPMVSLVIKESYHVKDKSRDAFDKYPRRQVNFERRGAKSVAGEDIYKKRP
jgi:hypothetical protein